MVCHALSAVYLPVKVAFPRDLDNIVEMPPKSLVVFFNYFEILGVDPGDLAISQAPDAIPAVVQEFEGEEGVLWVPGFGLDNAFRFSPEANSFPTGRFQKAPDTVRAVWIVDSRDPKVIRFVRDQSDYIAWADGLR